MAEVILVTDPRAATHLMIDGWKSLSGRVYTAERAARYDSATHAICSDCGVTCEKYYTACAACRTTRSAKQWDDLPKVPYNGEPAWPWNGDELLMDFDDVADYADRCEVEIEDLRLVKAKPVKMRELECDYWSDDLPPDGDDVPGWLQDAVDVLNREIQANGPCCWTDSKIAIDPRSISG